MSAAVSSSLGRAFTKRQKRPEVSAPMPFREGQPRFAAGTIKRSKISAPVELISTTNLLAYTAPDIQKHGHHGHNHKHQQPVISRPIIQHQQHSALQHSTSSSSSFRSADESDASNSLHTPSTTITSPSLPGSTEASPILRENGHYNQLTGYFDQQKDGAPQPPRPSHEYSAPPPSIPTRALSHTKKSHQELSRQRSNASNNSAGRRTPSLSNTSSPTPTSLSSAHATHSAAAAASRSHAQDAHAHPFGKELEQVNEVAEEFSAGQLFRDEDERILASKGLVKVDVIEYLEEVKGVYAYVFGGEVAKRDWI
ncbi:hypothetical protein MGYG_02874 [Nannizzia gypsea CBS 118893]|uniref:Uncharacterized protein n=1 Tax=Arthroderma gypseum (strain ATCC MYA-4604 / CBS 118893) TaxID=535722 RepID=E4UPI7_ARTGP|nr:hypothetical protein MGYG_02874 [Nannizzia gypsea CBS 118893]EFQ99862.1 hypothetical protein MGYG_02874 [Nannizzia gypsea CBS 118893]